jgi:hypothetical protein
MDGEKLTQDSGNYYSVRLLRQIVIEGDPDPVLVDQNYDADEQDFEESIVLIYAKSPEHARRIVEEEARVDKDSYVNRYNQKVTWKFIQVVDIFEIMDELSSGAEVYSCLHTTARSVTAESFIAKWFSDPARVC